MTTDNGTAEDALMLALTDVIRGATSPEIQQAQALLLRRLATQGDVIPSRIPAPLNITQIGGYFNLLSSLHEDTMRSEMLGAALGLATGGGPGLGAPPPMHLTSVQNQRPDGDAGAEVPLSVAVRQDFAPSLAAALAAVKTAGGMLPLWSPPIALPPTAASVPSPLPYLGREVWVAPSLLDLDPTTAPVTLGRAATDAAPGYRLAVRVPPGAPGASMLPWSALAWDPAGMTFATHDLGDISLLPIEAVLESTPFSGGRTAATPTDRADYGWARLTALGGLVPGVTRLGDELSLLWTTDQIAASALSAQVNTIWNGVAFSE